MLLCSEQNSFRTLSVTTQLEEQQRQYAEQTTQLRDANERYDQERRTNDDLIKTNGDLQSQARKAAERVQRTLLDLGNANTLLEQRSAEVATLRNQLATANYQIQALTDQRDGLSNQLQTMTDERNDLLIERDHLIAERNSRRQSVSDNDAEEFSRYVNEE